MLPDFKKITDDILLSKYTPPGVIVNDMMDIVHFRGSTNSYFEPSPGKASLNLFQMVRSDLSFELRNILHKAKTNNAPVLRENISIVVIDTLHYITIEAIPLTNTIEPYYLILFHDKTKRSSETSQTSREEGKARNDKDLRIHQLEQELLQLREDIRNITEEQEAANEELQSGNEELLVSSEELQSLNEELETSKEELQSANDELTALNLEMLSLNEQIGDAKNFAEAIVTTVREPLLVLDKNLQVKTANSAFYKTFSVNQQETEGMFIHELGNRQWNRPELLLLLKKAFIEKTGFAELEVTHNFPGIGERIMLLNAREIKRENRSENLVLLAIEDITEKSITRRAIEDANKRFQNAIMQSPFAFSIMKGEDMEITMANNQMKEFWGKGLEIEGKTLLQLLPELKEQPFPAMIDTAYITGKTVYANEMIAHLNHNGQIEDRYFNIIYQALQEADETISGVVSIAHEVTNQVLARKKIEESEQRFRNLVETAPSPICILKGKDMVLELANEPVFKIWNVGREALGKPFLEIIPEMKGQPFMKWLSDVFENGVTHYGNEEPAFIIVNGERRNAYFNFFFQPYRENDGSTSGVMVTATDVTEQVVARKKMEAQANMVHDLLINAPGFVATLAGPFHIYEIINEQYQGLFGQRKIQGKPIMEALPELEGQGFDKLLDTVYNSGKPYVGIDIPVILARDEHLAPEKRYFNFSYQPVYDENKNINSILVFGYEVTEQVIAKNRNLENEQARANELEEKVQQRTLELSKANENLIKMNQELESFTYVSSHDLQEPLRKIRTFVSFILQTEYPVLSDKGKSYLQRVNDAVVRMQTLIKDLLDYSHANITDCIFVKTDLDIILQEIKSDFNDTILGQSAILEAENLGEADISPFQFRQVINNLIANSLKFSKPGIPAHIIIKSDIVESSQLENQNPEKFGGKLPAGKPYFHISVTDNGIGFEPEYKDKIFHIFQRLHGIEQYAGTGIGLAIVKKIVDNHDGYITATGELGKGARFDIYLPNH